MHIGHDRLLPRRGRGVFRLIAVFRSALKQSSTFELGHARGRLTNGSLKLIDGYFDCCAVSPKVL